MSMAPKMVFFEELRIESHQGHDSPVEGSAVELRQKIVKFIEQRDQDVKGCHCKHIPIEGSEQQGDICICNV